jgi:hypothetical protein
MKKYLSVILTAFLLLLSGCDYPEKSFKALSSSAIPMEVTADFTLPRGVYAPFKWTSDNEAIIIDGLTAFVTQSDEDTLVRLTATINKKSRSFEILVLKTGSVTVYERARKASEYLEETYETLTSEITIMPKELEGLYIRYRNVYYPLHIGYYVDEENNTYLSNGFKTTNDKVKICVNFYKEQNFKTLLSANDLELLVEPMEENNPFILALEELNINDYSYDNGVIEITNLNVNDTIEFKETSSITYRLVAFPEYLEKTSSNQLKIIKKIDKDGLFHIHGLVITIGNMSKSVAFKLTMAK